MRAHLIRNEPASALLDRRAWLLRAACGGIGLASAAGHAARALEPTPLEEAAKERERAIERVTAASNRPLITASSDHYQAVGDARASFIKVTLDDCELIARDFLDHYESRGFALKQPDRRFTVVVFNDELPYLEFARKFARKVPPNAKGFYSRTENWLVLYDIRSDPAAERGGAHKNVRTLAHEATHQLCFNTGLLNRRGDVPFAIYEGLAGYGEPRRLHGRSEPGQINGSLLDAIAHIQRREKWIRAAELFKGVASSFESSADLTQLAYAQSWLLVFYLMKSPPRLPQFQAYLKSIHSRKDDKHRLDDAAASFGDLDRLDQELRREAIRLQKAPRPG